MFKIFFLAETINDSRIPNSIWVFSANFPIDTQYVHY